jgi:F-type H+-transporting ATPase subunit alpha
MSDLISEITTDLQKQIEAYQPEYSVRDVGTVLEAGDGIARANGLAKVRSQELVRFANGVMGTAFNLEQDSVGIIIMGDYAGIEEGMPVYATGQLAILFHS